LREALLNHFKDPNVLPHERPHHASLVSRDGSKTVLTIMATGKTTTEKVLAKTEA
jgi:hypothetical protein